MNKDKKQDNKNQDKNQDKDKRKPELPQNHSMKQEENMIEQNKQDSTREVHPKDKTGMAARQEKSSDDKHFKADDAEHDPTLGSRTQKSPVEGTAFQTSTQADEGIMDKTLIQEKPRKELAQEEEEE